MATKKSRYSLNPKIKEKIQTVNELLKEALIPTKFSEIF